MHHFVSPVEIKGGRFSSIAASICLPCSKCCYHPVQRTIVILYPGIGGCASWLSIFICDETGLVGQEIGGFVFTGIVRRGIGQVMIYRTSCLVILEWLDHVYPGSAG